MNQLFLSGVVEGFYGKPWTFAQRHKLIDWLHDFGLNTYYHGPKDDLKHRVLWRELLDEGEVEDFKKLIAGCAAKNIRFIYAISPGWDCDASKTGTTKTSPDIVSDLMRRFQQLLEMGCTHFAVQFDDVPNLGVDMRHKLALWHSETCNQLWDSLHLVSPEARLIMCPAIYCATMTEAGISRCDYLKTLGANLRPEVHIFWTGPDIISESISAEHLQDIAAVLKRPPLIWDNLHANDYDPARLHLGPYAGRTEQLAQLSTGVLLNPNCQFELNFVPLRTLGTFLKTGSNYKESDGTQIAAAAWLPEWERLQGEPFDPELVRLLIDCFYLPFSNGTRATELFVKAKTALNGDVQSLQFTRDIANQLSTLFFDLSTLKNRDLLDALWSPVWRLKDEFELIAQLATKTGAGPHPLPDFPDKIARGGLIRELQRLTRQHGAAGYSKEP